MSLPRPKIFNTSELHGKVLVANPAMTDEYFAETIILIFQHHKTFGSVGLILNKPHPNLRIDVVLHEIDITPGKLAAVIHKYPLYEGGKLSARNGFVLHSPYEQTAMITINPDVYVSSSKKILRDIVADKGPQRCMVFLGCTAWAVGQLEQEIKENYWFVTNLVADAIFCEDYKHKYLLANEAIGVNTAFLLSTGGNA